MEKNLVVGDDVMVLLPWWVQVHDGTEPYVRATITRVSDNTATVEYDTHTKGKQNLVVHELDRISTISTSLS